MRKHWLCTKKQSRRSVAGFLATVFFCVLNAVPAEAIDVSAFPQRPKLSAKAAVLMDADTGQVLYGVNEHHKLPPASLTKIMTCLLAMEYSNYGETASVTQEAMADVAGSTVLALTPGEEISLESLLYGMMARSANDAANALAIHIGGSLPNFVSMMNQMAQDLGADSTHFQNPSGLPHDQHLTTAYDLALITKAAYGYGEFALFAGTQQTTLPATNLAGERVVTNRNEVFASDVPYEGAFLGKTGWTQAAGRCLMTMAQRDGVTLICVVLGASSAGDGEMADTVALLDYGFNAFRRVTLPAERFPRQQVTYVDSHSTVQLGEIVFPGENMQVMLAQGVEVSALELHTVVPSPLNDDTMDRLRLELRLPEVAGEVMSPVAGSYPLVVQPLAAPAVAPQKEPFAWDVFYRVMGYTAGVLLLLFLMGLFAVRKISSRIYRRILNVQKPNDFWSDDEVYYFHSHRPTEEEMEEMRQAAQRKWRLFGVSMDDVQVVGQVLYTKVTGKSSAKKHKKSGKRDISSEELEKLKSLGEDWEIHLERLDQGYTVEEIVERQTRAKAEYTRLRELGASMANQGARKLENRSSRRFE